MKIVAIICRVLLGLAFVIFGANILHPFMPAMQPPPAGSPPAMFMAAMVPSGWIKVIGLFQLLGGLLVLAGGTAPLGLCLLAPVLLNILLFHSLLTGGHGIGAGLFLTVLELVLIYAYRANFAGIFSSKAKPTGTI